jgi:hypothetical protein
MKPVKCQGRHGDLVIARVADPATFQELKPAAGQAKAGVLAEGEATGHAHRIHGDDLANVDVFLNEHGRMVFQVKPGRTARVVHEEHEGFLFEEGTWEVHHQVEETPDGLRRVVD